MLGGSGGAAVGRVLGAPVLPTCAQSSHHVSCFTPPGVNMINVINVIEVTNVIT